MIDADNGMAKARQQTLPCRGGHLATHQMMSECGRREIGRQHQSGAHQDLLHAGRHAASPVRRLAQTSREFATPATAEPRRFSRVKSAVLTEESPRPHPQEQVAPKKATHGAGPQRPTCEAPTPPRACIAPSDGKIRGRLLPRSRSANLAGPKR